jgi:hypothetical protein
LTGPVGAFTLTGLQLLIGTFGVMWGNTILYPVINRGHYRAATWALFPLILVMALTLPSGTVVLGLAAGVLSAAFLAAVYLERPLGEKTIGALASAAGVGAMFASVGSKCSTGCEVAAIHALAGGFLLGTVTHAMVLGHWYLNQPRLPIEPLKGATTLLLSSAAISVVIGLATRSSLVGGTVAGSMLPFSSSGYWWGWLLLMAGVLALGAMIYSTVKRRSTQSATGLLYVAIMPAVVAQFVVNLLALP